jgi:methionyl-tRNA formyltransferase
MRLIFCGTPQFAVPALERLLAEDFVVSLVVTNPDEPRGRGYALAPSPVKEAAQKARVRVFQPARLKDPGARVEISSVQPDAIIVVAYGHIIPDWMIDLPRYGCINLHASLLPRYRGAAPIQWAVIRGENITGVTTMKIDRGLDTGDILLQEPLEIHREETAEGLSERLSVLGAGLMVKTLSGLGSGEIHPQPQDHSQATLAPGLKKEDGLIDWSLTAREIERRVRGLRPWPVAHSLFRGRKAQIWTARAALPSLSRSLQPGELSAESGKLFAGCGGATVLELSELQLEGRKRVSAREFVNGARLAAGERLGAG